MKSILGIDEVGRGALAGPVTVCGVLLDHNYPLETFAAHPINPFWKSQNPDLPLFQKIRDSKKLPAPLREKISEKVLDLKVPYVLLSASNLLIDRYGIGVCLSHLIWLVIQMISHKNSVDQVIVDGKITLLQIPNTNLLQALVIENGLEEFQSEFLVPALEILRENQADDRYLSIAMASNLAKVARDDYMKQLSIQYPDFGWDRNKGYGTIKHRNNITRESKNPYLRQSFIRRILLSLD